MVWYILIGIVIGVLITITGMLPLRRGVLKVYIPDQPDEPPYLYTELNKPVLTLCTSKYALFTVDVQHIKSQI